MTCREYEELRFFISEVIVQHCVTDPEAAIFNTSARPAGPDGAMTGTRNVSKGYVSRKGERICVLKHKEQAHRFLFLYCKVQ
jgi:hypothetical protein